MSLLCSNVKLRDDMKVFFRNKTVTLKEAIDNCKPGEPIEGIHPFQYDKLQKRFEEERNKIFQYSVDIRYGNWRFILFDINKNQIKTEGYYTDPKYDRLRLPEYVTPISLN